MSWSERIEMRGRDEMDGQPEGRECGMQSSQSIGAKLDEVLVKVRELFI
jgi:hypothetical protein